MKEIHKFLYLSPTLDFGSGKALGKSCVHIAYTSTVHRPFIFPYSSVNIDGLAGDIPLPCRFSFGHSPMKRPVAHTVNFPELMQMCFYIRTDFFIIHITDMAEQGCRLDFSGIFISLYKWGSGSSGYISVSACINYDFGP